MRPLAKLQAAYLAAWWGAGLSALGKLPRWVYLALGLLVAGTIGVAFLHANGVV